MPGLHGSFLFDDFNNLQQLGAYGTVDNFRSLILYLTSGNADPTGRPLTLLSFLLDANNWPADAEPFKRTNILLHLLNSVLLSWVLLRLGRRLLIDERRAQYTALLGAALWSLHPFLVSTTLYVVQREAMLPATFTLIAMLLWMSGVERLHASRRGGIELLVGGAWGCTALAVLCKANGALIPLLLLIMDWTIPPAAVNPGPHKSHALLILRVVLLGLPSLLLAGWLASKTPAIFAGDVFMRPWSVGQRLLTEPRVICDYLKLLWIPRASGTSVFNDGYAVSTGLLHPATTLPAIVVVLVLIGMGFAARRKYPALAFAILFYFAGHLLESTLIPLELYFEHRNYLPALVMFWPLALWLTGAGILPVLRFALAITLPLAMAALCHARASVWGQPYEQARLLADLDPSSPRAQVNAATFDADHGRPDLARLRLWSALRQMPDEAQLALNLVTTECRQGAVSTQAIEAAKFALVNNLAQTELVQDWLIHAINAAQGSDCRGLNLSTVEAMVKAMRQNPHYSKGSGHQYDIHQLEGRLALAQGRGDEALREFNLGLSAFATPDGALSQAALLGAAGFPSQGLEHLRYFKTLPPAHRNLQGMAAVHLWLLEREGYWDSEWTALEKQLREDAAKDTHSSASPSA